MMVSKRSRGGSTKPDWLPVEVRWMIRRDMPEVLEIEERCFAFPWREEDYVNALKRSNCIGQVAENSSGDVLGVIVYEIHRDTFVVANLAVHPDYWRRGIATQLLAKLVGKLSHNKKRYLRLEVSERNLPAQLFLKSCGIRAIGILYESYADTDEDCIVFQLEAAACEEPGRREFEE